MACQDIGISDPDIAGVGVILSVIIQSAIAFLLCFYMVVVGLPWNTHARALCLYAFFWPVLKLGEVITRRFNQLNSLNPMFERALLFLNEPLPQRTEKGVQKQKLAKEILVAISYAQTWTGIALLIAAFVQFRTYSIYHMYIIYEIACLVALSNCGVISLICGPVNPNYYGILIWFGFHISYTIAFGRRLSSWDDDKPGQCYISASGTHPSGDHWHIYGSCFNTAMMIYTAIGGSVSKPLETRVPAIFQALMFYLRHISSLYDLRKANEPFLVQGNTEQDWGFGQVAAVALLGNNVTMVLVAIWKYRQWRKRLVQVRAPAPLLRALTM